jgi:hypothetical protein
MSSKQEFRENRCDYCTFLRDVKKFLSILSVFLDGFGKVGAGNFHILPQYKCGNKSRIKLTK